MRLQFRNRVPLPPPSPSPLKKIKFLICGVSLIKFEAKKFHVFTNNNKRDRNLEMGIPFPQF